VDPVSLDKRALVHTASKHDIDEDSVLCEVWHTDFSISLGTREKYRTPILRSLSLSAFVVPVYAIEEFPGVQETIEDDNDLVYCMSRCIIMKDIETEWGKLFA